MDTKTTPPSAFSPPQTVSGHPGLIPRAPALAAVKRKPRRMLLIAGVLMAVLGGLGAFAMTQRSAQRITVIGVAREVPWGQVITGADLVAVQIVADPALAPVPWTQEPAVIGQRAAAELPTGTLLTLGSVTGAAVPPAGQALVGVAVKPTQEPGAAPTAGDTVLLVIVPDSSAATASAAAPGTVTATVLDPGSPDASGDRTVDVLLPQADAARVAAAVAAGRVSIVVLPRGPGR